jgi:hypothetical protein
MEHSAIIGACSSAGIIREDVLQETTALNFINLHREGPLNMYGPLQKGLASVRVQRPRRGKGEIFARFLFAVPFEFLCGGGLHLVIGMDEGKFMCDVSLPDNRALANSHSAAIQTVPMGFLHSIWGSQ